MEELPEIRGTHEGVFLGKPKEEGVPGSRKWSPVSNGVL